MREKLGAGKMERFCHVDKPHVGRNCVFSSGRSESHNIAVRVFGEIVVADVRSCATEH